MDELPHFLEFYLPHSNESYSPNNMRTIISIAYYFFPKKIKCFHFFGHGFGKVALTIKRSHRRRYALINVRGGEGEIWFSHQGTMGIFVAEKRINKEG